MRTKMRIIRSMRFYLGLLVLLTPGCLFGWDAYQADVSQRAATAVSDGVDHLEPVDRKMPETPYLLEYIREPALGYQHLHLTLTQDQQSGKFYLRTWGEWRKENEARPLTEVLQPLTKIEFPVDLASSVYGMWVNALLEVRYDRLSQTGLDGWTDLFSAHINGRGWLHGAAWSPTKDLPPKWMEDSALAMVQFVKDKDEQKCRATLADLRNKLVAYLSENGKH